MSFLTKYNIFIGSTSWKEWWYAVKTFFSFKKDFQQQDVIEKYEKLFAEKTQTQYAYSFGAGRMALYAILEALNLNAGDEVILPAYTCVVVPNALLYKGLKPIYVDIELQTFNIDVSKVEALITDKTKVLYAQHTFGAVCDMKALRKLADKYNLYLMEDAAHALGAIQDGQQAGSIGDVAFFSTDHSKMINTLLGGMVVTNNTEIAQRVCEVQKNSNFLSNKLIRKLIQTYILERILLAPMFYRLGRYGYAICARLKLFFYFSDENMVTKPKDYPYPCRLSSFQANLGISQLKSLDENLKHRKRIANILDDEFKVNATHLNAIDFGNHSWLRYSFLLPDRGELEKKLQNELDAGVWFTTIFQGRCDNFELVGYEAGSCKNAEYAAKHIFNFPTHQLIPTSFIKKLITNHGRYIKNNVINDK